MWFACTRSRESVQLHCPQCPGIVPCIPANAPSPAGNMQYNLSCHRAGFDTCTPRTCGALSFAGTGLHGSPFISVNIFLSTVHHSFQSTSSCPSVASLGASRWIDTCGLLPKCQRSDRLMPGSFPAISLGSICGPTWACLQPFPGSLKCTTSAKFATCP